MKKVILALATLCCFAAPAFADKPAPPPVHHRKHKKKVVVVPPASPTPPVVETPSPVVPPPVVVAPPPPAPVPPPKAVFVPRKLCGLKPTCPAWEEKSFIASAHLAIGVGAQAPWASGLLGVRMEFPKLYLGVEPFVSLPYGVGVDGMVYAYRGKTIQFYPLSVGFMINWNQSGVFGTNVKYLSDNDIHRIIDLRLGAGLQIKLACHVSLAIDWRVSIPDPVMLGRENNVCKNCGTNSRRLDANTAVGNAFAQSQLLVGILIR